MGHEIKPILGGFIKPKSNVSKIWMVFWLLSVVTIVEVILGIIKPAFLVDTKILGMKLLNWVFIILTVYKAYYITWSFMHMDGEKKWFRRSVVWTAIFLILYLSFIVLVEGDYIYEIMKRSFVTRDF
ncbi:cytochrome C oxidase subunit IV family protein [Pseudofulvibacter geojedonensis]|uniref:Cytochrome C oxidase subunit IV family protein n=1 Tax=Pseudofulvibacter geojedonensis TaxID=1123758 RepID=A0ABW3I1D6_9FLAO